MKKLTLLLCCLFLVACKQPDTIAENKQAEVATDEKETVENEPVETVEEKVLKQPVIILANSYIGRQSFTIDDVVDYEGDVVLVLDGKTVEQTVELDYGDHNIVAYTKAGDKQSPHAFFTVSIRDENAELITLYKEPSESSMNFQTLDYDYEEVKETHVTINNGQLEVWHQIKNKNIEGYFKGKSVREYKYTKLVFICEEKNFELPGTYWDFSQPYLDFGYFHVADSSDHYIIHQKSGEVIRSHYFHAATHKRRVLSEDEGLTIYELSEEGIKRLLRLPPVNVSDISFLGDELYYTLYDSPFKSERSQYVLKESNSWQPELINEQIKRFDIFRAPTMKDLSIGTVPRKALEDHTSPLITTLTETGIYSWVEYENGYIYVPVEPSFYYNHYYDVMGKRLKTTDDQYISFMESSAYSDDGIYLLDNGLNSTLLYDAQINESRAIHKLVSVSPDREYILTSKREDDDLALKVYRYQDRSFEHVFSHVFKDTSHFEINWKDDVEIIAKVDSDDFFESLDGVKETFYTMNIQRESIKEQSLQKYFDVYSDMTRTEIVGQVNGMFGNYKDPLHIYENYEGQIGTWFKVTGHVEGYVFKPIAHEVPYHVSYDRDKFTIRTEKEDLEIVIENEVEGRSITNDLSALGYITTYSKYEWVIAIVYNILNGESFAFSGEPVVSPDQAQFYALDTIYGEGVTYISFYDVDRQAITRQTEILIGRWNIIEDRWISDNEVQLTLTNGYQGVIKTAVLKQIDGKWSYELE